MRLFRDIITGTFLERPNRFIVKCSVDEEIVKAYLPNPGRLWELFFLGTRLYLTESDDQGRKLRYTVVAVETMQGPVMLHTHRTNDVARFLLENELVSGLEGSRIVRSEIKIGKSRFDFKLEKNGEEILLEVKSCTLFSKNVAMFPDAVTKRGKRHVEELQALSKRGMGTALLFVVQSKAPSYFLPEYHTDLEFSKALLKAKDDVIIKAVAISWDSDLRIKGDPRSLEIPWGVLEREAKDQGTYMVLLRLKKDETIEVGALGNQLFKKGYYLYVGSAKKALSKRLARHRRKRKNMHWHIDHLIQRADFIASLPVLTSDDIECDLAGSIANLFNSPIPGFGSSDCRCETHLFHARDNPLDSRKFHGILQYYRMERPL